MINFKNSGVPLLKTITSSDNSNAKIPYGVRPDKVKEWLLLLDGGMWGGRGNQQQPSYKIGKRHECIFHQEEIQMPNQYMKRYSASGNTIREMQIENNVISLHTY